MLLISGREGTVVCGVREKMARLAGSPMFRKTREGWNCRFQKTPRTEGGDKVPAVSAQGSRQVCLSRCPKSYNLRHFAIRENFSSNFPGIFPELSCRTPAKTPETATAFSSFLICLCSSINFSWWTFRIYFIFSLRGQGKRWSPTRQQKGVGCIENPRRGVSQLAKGGGRGAGRVSAGNFRGWGGGG